MARDRVLDDDHGIEIIDHGLSGQEYLPWYRLNRKEYRNGHASYYYTRVVGWQRVVYHTWLEAFDHIARSRRMLTHDMPGSNYLAEAMNAGVELPGTQARDEQLREALASIERSYRAGNLSDMDVFHLINGNKPTSERE